MSERTCFFCNKEVLYDWDISWCSPCARKIHRTCSTRHPYFIVEPRPLFGETLFLAACCDACHEEGL